MENECFPFPARALEFCQAGRVRSSRPVSACFLSTLGVNLVLTRGIPTDFGGDVRKFVPPQPIGSARSFKWSRNRVPMAFACYMLSDTERIGGEIKNRSDRYTVVGHKIVVPAFIF